MGETLAGEVAKEVEAIISRDYPKHVWFAKSNCYREGEKGSSLDLNVVREGVLKRLGLGLPSLLEGKHLDGKKALSNGVYREYGLQIASKGGPNAEIGKYLIAEAEKREWNLPLVVPSYSPLGHRKGKDGFEIYFLGDKEGVDLESEVKHGEEAREFLGAQFNPDWIGKNGVLGLGRYWFGYWIAIWGDRNSYDVGRVDFVSGEASAENLKVVKDKELAEKYDAEAGKIDVEIAKLTSKRAQLVSQREANLDSFSKLLKG